MTERDTVHLATLREGRRHRSGNQVGSLPSDATIIHTEAAGGTGPLYVWYRRPPEENDGDESA